MPRDLTPDMLTALTATVVRPALLVEANFNDAGTVETVYMWTGVGTLTWNGHDWQGLGSFIGVAASEEGTDVEARGITINLSALDPALLAGALQEFQIGLPVIVYFALFNEDLTLVPNPVKLWSGFMDRPTISVSGTRATIALSCESRMIELNAPVARRYTFDDAQLDHPGDQAFMFVNGIQEITTSWGRVPSSSTNV